MSDKPRVMIGTPHNGIFSPEYVQSYSQTVFTMMDRYDMGISTSESAQIHLNRNNIISEAYNHKADYLIFIDTDMMWESKHIEKLINFNKDVVGGICTTRKKPFAYCVYDSDGKGGIQSIKRIPKVPFRCFAIGTGFLLLRKSVITRLWDERAKHGYPFDPIPHGMTPSQTKVLTSVFGEDISFCCRLRKLGIDIWCEPSVRPGHVGSSLYGVGDDE
jgi:hypothetical protein